MKKKSQANLPQDIHNNAVMSTPQTKVGSKAQ